MRRTSAAASRAHAQARGQTLGKPRRACHPSPVPRSPRVLALVLVTGPLACTSQAPSRLQARDGAGGQAPAPATPSPSAPAKAPEAKAPEKPEPKPGELVAEPPPGTELAEIRLTLREGAVYKVTTVGNVEFGSVMQGTAFAREERLALSACSGAGFTRACSLEHRYVHFDAEPPGGAFLKADEEVVKGLVTRHALRATGERTGQTEVSGPPEQAEGSAGKALADAHRFYCLRFPEQPIGVGARWRSKCQMRSGGVIDTRDVIWELSKLENDPDTGRRAELKYIGKYLAPGKKGTREGAVSGILYFLVDVGEPHLLREQFTTASDAASGFRAKTTVAYQFSRLERDKEGKEIALRVDGKPFPEAPAAPAGELMSPAEAPGG